MSSNGKLLAAGGSDDSTLKFFNLDDGSLIRSVEVGGAVYTTRLNPAGTHAVISTADQALKVVEVASGRIVVIDAVIGYVTEFDFSPDGRWMGSPAGGSIVIWDARTWKEARRLEGHPGGATAIAFSPDSRSLASTGSDGTPPPEGPRQELKLWEIPSGRLLATPPLDPRGASRVSFAGNGRSVVVTGGDARIRIFGLAGDPVPVPNPAPRKAGDPAFDGDDPGFGLEND